MTLQRKDPTGGGVHGELTLHGQAGVITRIRRCNPRGDNPPNWACDIAWNVSDEKDAPSYPTMAHIYVGTILDDSHAPFLEVVIQDGKDVRRPYGYAKRQADDGDAVGLSDAEKERLNFLTIAKYDAIMEIKEAEERKFMDERLLKEKLEKEERKKREEEMKKELAERRKKEKAERIAQEGAERMQQPKPQENIQKPREVHDGMTNKQRKAAQKQKIYEEKRAARWEREDAERRQLMEVERNRRTNESQQARKELAEEQKRLIKEESRFDLLRNLPSAASGSSIQTPYTAPTFHRKLEGVHGASAGFRGFSNAAVKREEVLPTLDRRGVKRTLPYNPSNDSNKRMKLE